MALALRKTETLADGVKSVSVMKQSPAQQAFRTLQLGFTVAPIVAGLDKFFHMLVDWDQYLAPQIARLLGGAAHPFMLGVGAVEVIAGIGVALIPRIFGYVV